ncbi:uncharacterized protein LOC110179011 [Drosophila serrata]|uniref:uncharacterized protein LOC110179011 n=1 Tax=Drosophila serrata TaxID=7274 RepID=UPI000A1D3574|nr:uncharacterized protein LOC110179011 [Drosophila serrata]
MAQLKNPGQGQPAAVVGPTLASAMLLMGLVFALIGIKLFGFRRRLTFDRSQVQQQQQQQQSQQPPPRYAAFESQVNGTDSAVHGVFRRRNLEEFESPWPSASTPATTTTGNRYMTGSVPNLQLFGVSPREAQRTKVSYREKTLEQRRRRLEVNSEHYEYTAPPTRQPPSPPTQPEMLAEDQPAPPAAQEPVPSVTLPKIVPEVPKTLPLIAPLNQSMSAAPREAVSEPQSELGMPNFDHFAEKYELISVKPCGEATRPTQLRSKDSGRYVKFDPVDDVPELLTPEDSPPEPLTPDDGLEGALSVTAVVHRGAIPKEEAAHEPEPTTEPEPELQESMDPFEEAGKADSAFVVEIIAGSPEVETTPIIEPTTQQSLFDDLELPLGNQDRDFQRIRNSFVIHEADILDVDQHQLPAASSPPGFGKSIDEDWENFANLDAVVDVPAPNWDLHPNSLEQVPAVETTLSEATLQLDNVEQVEGLFHQLELLEPRMEIFEPEPQPIPCVDPPPYDPGVPYLPDYDSLMQLESSRGGQNLPKYTEVMEQRSKKANYVSSIEDLYDELEVNGVEVAGSPTSTAQSNGVSNFEDLCQEMSVAATPSPPRQVPQPAPRSSRPSATLNVRGDTAPPLACYQPEELPSSSSSDADGEDGARSAPQPARRDPRALKVRFDVDNLQYYQSAEVVTSSGLESEEDDYDLPRPTPMQRSIVFETPDNRLPSLFGAQVSQGDSDEEDDGFGRAISQHRSMTAALRTHNIVRGDTEA